MSVLSKTEITKRLPLGDRVLQSFRVTTGSADATAEWLATGFSEILGVIGFAVKGTTPVTGGTATALATATNTIPWIATNPSDGDTVTVNDVVYTLKTTITAQAAAVSASQTVTFGATDIDNADTITVNGRIYTFNTTPSGLNSVDINATEVTQAAIFANAINAGTAAVSASSHSDDTPANVDVQATSSGAVVTLTALVPGVGVSTAGALTGNSMTLSTIADANQIALGAATFSGGTDEIIPVPYEVLLSGTEATMSQNFVKAINGTGTPGTEYSLGTAPNPVCSASHDTVTTTLTARVPGVVGNALKLAQSSTGITAVGGATFSGGVDVVPDALGFNFVLNARGTGVTAGDNRGDLGIECSQASKVVEITVIGRP